MPRPKLHSDDQILSRARDVLVAKGPSAFTLSDVAVAVGMSRAALIQRFTDKATLHRRIMELMTAEVRAYFGAASAESGLTPLWALLRDLIAGMGDGEGTEGYLLLYWEDVQQPDLLRLARQRNELVRRAIRERLPSAPHSVEETATLIQAVFQGACMQWIVSREGRLADFMTEQTRRVMALLYPQHHFD